MEDLCMSMSRSKDKCVCVCVRGGAWVSVCDTCVHPGIRRVVCVPVCSCDCHRRFVSVLSLRLARISWRLMVCLCVTMCQCIFITAKVVFWCNFVCVCCRYIWVSVYSSCVSGECEDVVV